MSGVYPLKFEPLIVPKPWGGSRIAAIHPELGIPPTKPTGESWEFVDLPGKSSVIANGPWKGRTFAQILIRSGEELISDVRPTSQGGFPLMIKYLDAREDLSIQVHPSSGHGAKTEALYVINAEKDAVIYRGFNEQVSAQQARTAIENGTIAEQLARVRARPDRCYFMPGGTCHAYGAGIFGVEIQIPSETTFRVFDWGRGDRDLHVEEAIACMNLQPANVAENEKRSHVAGVYTSMSMICNCDYFTIEKVRMAESWEQEIPYDRPSLWIVLEGRGKIIDSPAGIDVAFAKGDVLFVPPNMPQAKVILEKDTQWLDVQIPHGPNEVRLA
jgi:mannose-6-phosphate isomerase